MSFTAGVKPGACFRFVRFENRDRAGIWHLPSTELYSFKVRMALGGIRHE